MKRLHATVFILFLLSAVATACTGTPVAKGVSSAPSTVAAESPSTPTPTGSPDIAANVTTVALAPVDEAEAAQTMVGVEEAAVATADVTSTVATTGETPLATTGTESIPQAAVTETVSITPTAAVASTPPPGAVAVVNGQVILKKDYDRQFNLAKAALKAQGQDLNKPEGKKLLENIRGQVLEDMINMIIIRQAAVAQGIKISKKDVDTAAEKSIQEGGGRAGFERWLKDTGQTEADYRTMIETQLITEAIANKITGKLPAKAPQVHARHILLDTEGKAKEVLGKLKAGEDFAALAKKYSVDQGTKDKGGDLGWFPRNMMPPEIDAVVFNMEPKKISDIVKDSFGAYHIFQVLEKDNARALTKEQLHALNAAAFGRWLAEQRLSAKIERYIEFKD